MKGTIVIEGVLYNVYDRIAHMGDLIITMPNLFDHQASIHDGIYNIPYNTIFEVNHSQEKSVRFKNRNAKYGISFLNHHEYYVVVKNEKENRVRIKTGENVIIKKFLGITFYKKIISSYEYKKEGEINYYNS